jgi:hydroxyacylglutathione hydrolase
MGASRDDGRIAATIQSDPLAGPPALSPRRQRLAAVGERRAAPTVDAPYHRQEPGVVMPQRPAPLRLEPRDLDDRLSAGAILVDTRDPRVFGAGHVTGSLNVWIDGPQFAERVAWFVPPRASLALLVETEADVARAVPPLARVGLDDVAGYVVGTAAVRASGLPVGTLTNVTVQELAHRVAHEPDLVVLDVREPAEWMDGHMPGARHIPMRQVEERIAEIPRDRRVALTCAGGTRSSLVASLLLARGFTDLVNVWGGMNGWVQAGLPIARD